MPDASELLLHDEPNRHLYINAILFIYLLLFSLSLSLSLTHSLSLSLSLSDFFQSKAKLPMNKKIKNNTLSFFFLWIMSIFGKKINSLKMNAVVHRYLDVRITKHQKVGYKVSDSFVIRTSPAYCFIIRTFRQDNETAKLVCFIKWKKV